MDAKLKPGRRFEIRHTKKSRQLAALNARRLRSRLAFNAAHHNSFILDLPREILVIVLSYLPARDLLKAREISVEFKKIIHETKQLWIKVKLNGLQPMVHGDVTRFFEKLASYGNAEASIKLAIHNLYFFNLKDVEKTKVAALECAKQSCEQFLNAENVVSRSFYPFTWIFTRPPWVLKSGGLSNKELIFRLLVEVMVRSLKDRVCQEDKNLLSLLLTDVLKSSVTKSHSKSVGFPSSRIHGKLAFNIAKLLMLCDTEQVRMYGIQVMQLSSKLGNINATYEVLRLTEEDSKVDPGCKVHWHRKLRNCALSGNSFAKLHLCVEYAAGRIEDIDKKEAQAYVKQIMQSCKESHIHLLRNYQKELEDLMRVILIDWLIEITDTKDMPPETIFMAVDLLDRYLMARPVRRVNLQLAGTTALLISTRFCCERNQLLTIRESSWLTDNTYGYREVVYMMAEYTGVLKGQFMLPNLHHISRIISTLAKFNKKDDMMLRYLLESSLKFTEFGRYKSSLIVSAAALIVNIVQNYDAWPSNMEQYTGYEVIDLANCAMLLSSKCLSKLRVLDDREQLVEAADQKYSREQYLQVARHKFPTSEEFMQRILSLDDRLVPVQEEDCCRFEVSMIDSSPLLDLNSSLDYEADCEDYVGDVDSSFDELTLFHPQPKRNDDGDCSDVDLNEEVEDILDVDARQGFVDREGATPSFYSDNENELRLLPHRVHHSTRLRIPPLVAEEYRRSSSSNKQHKRLKQRRPRHKLKVKDSSSDEERQLRTDRGTVNRRRSNIRPAGCLLGLKRPAGSRDILPSEVIKKRKTIL